MIRKVAELTRIMKRTEPRSAEAVHFIVTHASELEGRDRHLWLDLATVAIILAEQ